MLLQRVPQDPSLYPPPLECILFPRVLSNCAGLPLSLRLRCLFPHLLGSLQYSSLCASRHWSHQVLLFAERLLLFVILSRILLLPHRNHWRFR